VDLIITSPPFPLLRQKEYGNQGQDVYVDWLLEFGRLALPKLKDTGSLVLDIGGAYVRGRPVRSLHQFRVAIAFCDQLGYRLAQDFYWHNPSKLPSPIEWVNKRKIRAKDSVNTVWWFAKSDFPKAHLDHVRVEYSKSMQRLLVDPRKYYTPKGRPSQHSISDNFARDNGGAIPSNLLAYPNTESNSSYLRNCRILGVQGHPARFPSALPSFFIKLLTDPGDLVLDIFSGSNTTGAAAEQLARRWLAIEIDPEYAAASSARFLHGCSEPLMRQLYERIKSGDPALLAPTTIAHASTPPIR
jgi:site-specific DNA-methyltransferase (cytosine-N4-specific)